MQSQGSILYDRFVHDYGIRGLVIFQQTAYMFDLIAPYIPPRSLRSSNKNLLIVPDIRSEIGRRSLSFTAPTTWNSLLQHIRSSDSLSVFKGLLKTFLYQRSLPA